MWLWLIHLILSEDIFNILNLVVFFEILVDLFDCLELLQLLFVLCKVLFLLLIQLTSVDGTTYAFVNNHSHAKEDLGTEKTNDTPTKQHTGIWTQSRVR